MLKTITINVPAPALAAKELLGAWAHPDTKVFVMKADGPINDVKTYYNHFLPLIGTPSTLAEDVRIGDRTNQRTGEIWMEVRYDSLFPDAYRHSASAQPLHTDGSYVSTFPNAGLLACVANTGIGGETTFLDSKNLVASLEREAPKLLKALTQTVIRHSRSGDSREYPVIRNQDGKFLLNWNYYCVDESDSIEAHKLKEDFHRYLLDSKLIKEKTLEIKLAPGDAVIWKDNEVLHGRNGFTPTKESERFIWKCAIDIGHW